MRVCGCLFVLVLCTSYSLNSYALSYFLDGNGLHTHAVEYRKLIEGSQGANSLVAGMFVGFIKGVTDTTFKTGLYCLPNNITTGKDDEMVANYLEKHPEKWNQPAVDIVVKAMQETYPCPK
jgi:hypothetical protein